MDYTQYQHIPAYLHWHRKILTRLKQFIVANSFLDMPIWREICSREVYHVHSFSSLMLFLLFPCVASASPFSIQPSVSTLGVGVDISYRQNSFIAYRLSAFTQPFDTKIKLKGIQYKTEDYSHSVGLLLDIFPFENAFRISAGAYYFKLDTALSTSVDAINPIYEELINQTSGKATWERLAPYIGLGWESTQQSESSLGWHASLGALYMGKARVSFQLPDVPIPKRYVGRIQAKEDNIKNKVHKYTWYPVLSLGFTYLFNILKL